MLGVGIPRPSEVGPICAFTDSLDFLMLSYPIISCLPGSTTQETSNEILLNKRIFFHPIHNARENTSLYNTMTITQKWSNRPISVDSCIINKHPLSLCKLVSNIHHVSYLFKSYTWDENPRLRFTQHLNWYSPYSWCLQAYLNWFNQAILALLKFFCDPLMAIVTIRR